MINILYAGRKIYQNLTEEEAQEILLDMAEQVYDGVINQDEIELEEI